MVYEEFLSETLKAEKDCNDGKSSVTGKIKSAVATDNVSIPSIQKLTKEINALNTIVKSANMDGGCPKTIDKGRNPPHKNRNGSKGGQNSSPRKGKGPAISAAGPFKPGQKPFQCYQCGGWGHGFRECPTLRGLDWMGFSGGCTTSSRGERPEPENPQ